MFGLWATILGAAGAIGMGHAIDRLGSRRVLTVVSIALGLIVCAMSQTTSPATLAVWLTLTRAFGQSALSVISLAMVGHWFVRRIDLAMAVYSVLMSIGFMVAFPIVGLVVQRGGWRVAWLGIGCALILVLAPAAWVIVRRSPESCGLAPDGGPPAVLTARGETLAAFDGRGILAGGVAPPSNTGRILGRRALPSRRLARLDATPEFHHGLLIPNPRIKSPIPNPQSTINQQSAINESTMHEPLPGYTWRVAVRTPASGPHSFSIRSPARPRRTVLSPKLASNCR